MKDILKVIKTALISIAIIILLCGVFYTGIITGISQMIFPNQANGSIITITLNNGTKKDYGSSLIAQKFTKPKYLIGRPLGVTNISPTSEEQKRLVQERIIWWHKLDPDNKENIPMDLVTSSGSGVDPSITPEAAEYQVVRIARERNIDQSQVRKIIRKYTTGRFLGFWGEPAVNVLKVNLALDGLL